MEKILKVRMKNQCNLKVLLKIIIVFFFFITASKNYGQNLKIKNSKVINEKWFVIYMMNIKVGYMYSKTESGTYKGDQVFQTTEKILFKVKRFGNIVKRESLSVMIENKKGKLVAFSYYNKDSGNEEKIWGKANGGLLTYSIQTKHKTEKKSSTMSEKMIMPYYASLYEKKMGYKTGTHYEYELFTLTDIENPMKVTIDVKDKEKIGYLGNSLKLRLIQIRFSIFPEELTRIWVDDQGEVWIMDISFMGIKAYKADEKSANLDNTKEFLYYTLIKPYGRVPKKYSKAEEILFKVWTTSDASITLPDNEFQNVKKRGKYTFLKTIKKYPNINKKVALPVNTPKLNKYLQQTEFMQIEHPEIKELAEKILDGETNAIKAFIKIQEWVHQNIKKKNFSILYDSALDVARKLEGDCTEHSILFTALARASGIPARLVFGLVYLPMPGGGAFGYHQWAEVWVGDWIAVDPTLNQNIADATHIIFYRSDNGISNLAQIRKLLPILKLIGQLRIEFILAHLNQSDRSKYFMKWK